MLNPYYSKEVTTKVSKAADIRIGYANDIAEFINRKGSLPISSRRAFKRVLATITTIVRNPKSGREAEIIFIPQKVADRLKAYVKNQNIGLQDRIFPICYEAARSVVMKDGKLVGIHLRPHDLRRHAATFASRSGVPIEIISKLILRHSNLSTTQNLFGKDQRFRGTEMDWNDIPIKKLKGGLNQKTTLAIGI